ncbi:heterokaryon incompatibility protein-domain-containing protein [Phaeosphaeria sp. MPI-PUGE-AT-0046c]|nr:heterokaryon incompatibility protein-domain-containing protein [Phaeosphaeria sp. MPI-PUGE-AT-0046c]
MEAIPPDCSIYQYDDLSVDLAIRLLILFPAESFGAPLRCKLETTDLLTIVQSTVYDKIGQGSQQTSDDPRDEASDLAYEALSYTWGSKEHTAHIMFDDNKFIPITANLEAFLRYRREKLRPVRLWVDAVSINQKNTAECDAQVQLMNRIYAAAPSLTIWLGPPDSESDAAMRELDILSDGHPFEKLDPMERSVFAAIEKLLTRNWWERVWIIQELRFGANYYI